MIKDLAIQCHNQADNQKHPCKKTLKRFSKTVKAPPSAACITFLFPDILKKPRNLGHNQKQSCQHCCRNQQDSCQNQPFSHRKRKDAGNPTVGIHPDWKNICNIPITKSRTVPCCTIQQDNYGCKETKDNDTLINFMLTSLLYDPQLPL